MRNEPYNGWTNWHTWNTHLWLTNDELVYRSARVLSRIRSQRSLRILATEVIPETEGVDFVRVNWEEIMKALSE